MSTATIKVAYVNQPKPTKKFGSVKDDGGTYYSVTPAMLGQFSPGGTYTVEYRTSDAGYHTITSITQAQAPAASAASGGGKYGSTDDATSERIFVCGALNAFISAGRIEPTAQNVTAAVNALRSSWSNTFGGKAVVPQKKQTEEELNDEIPWS